ncbi:MAG: MFS transporter [Pseudomonadota bacterium]
MTNTPTSNRMHAVGVLVFLTLLNVLNFADRFLMQGFAVDMTADLQLSNLQFTLLTGFVFTTFYTLVGVFMGALADRFHRPRLMAGGIFVWSALTAVTGLATNFVQVGMARMFIGVGEATLTPAALGLLGDKFSKKHRAFAAGFYYLGAPVGIGAAFIIAGTLGAAIGWRNCFYLLGALGVLLAPCLLLLREPRASLPAGMPSQGHRAGGVFQDIRRALAASPALCLVVLGGVLVIFAQGALVLDQLWLVQERGFSKAHAQRLAGVMFLAGGVVGALLGGYCSDLMQARRPGGRLYFLALVYSVGVPVGFLFRYIDPAGAAFYPCMFLGAVMVTIGYGPIFACVQDLVPDNVRSTMTAFLIMCMTLFGTSAGNLLVGWLADSFRAMALAEPITQAVLVGMTPWLLAIPCFYLAARSIEKAQPRPC